jgi:hypothetical protein
MSPQGVLDRAITEADRSEGKRLYASNLVGKGVVTDIDHRDRLIYLRVDWATLAPEKLPGPAELMAQVAAHTQAPARWYAEPLPA